jgi:acetyl-CoA acetyltransferase
MNPNGGSVALGHPFAATGARILSQAVKEPVATPRVAAPSSALAPTAAFARPCCL